MNVLRALAALCLALAALTLLGGGSPVVLLLLVLVGVLAAVGSRRTARR